MGHAAGGVFNTTARSGSNSWHGSALFVSKPGWATGQLYFAKKAGVDNPPQYFRELGRIASAVRIVKNRTFFWFSTDNYSQLGTRNNVLTMPTALERSGDFSQTRNAAGQLGHDLRSADDAAERRGTVRARSVSGQRDSGGSHQSGCARDPRGDSDARVRQDVQRRRVAARRSAAPADHQGRSPLVRSLDDDRDVRQAEDPRTGIGLLRRRSAASPAIPAPACCCAPLNFVALNNVFVPNSSTTVTVRYGDNRFDDSGSNYPAFDATTLGFPAGYVSQLTYNTFPAMVHCRLRRGDNGRQYRTEQHHSHHPHGERHGVEAGRASHAEGRRRVPAHRGGRDSVRRLGRDVQLHAGIHAGIARLWRARSAGDAFASFLLGYPASGSVVSATPGQYLIDYVAAYAQDEVRITPSLTVNYGLRYEHEPGVRERDNHITVGFDRDTRVSGAGRRPRSERRAALRRRRRQSRHAGTAR